MGTSGSPVQRDASTEECISNGCTMDRNHLASEEGFTPEQRAFMTEAIKEAERAHEEGEVPVGCVFVRDGTIIARGSNATNVTRNGTRHAEMMAIDKILAAETAAADFSQCDLYVTVEPCIMCAGALSLIGIREVFYGCPNDKFGGNGSIMSIHVDGCSRGCDQITHNHHPTTSPLGKTYKSTGGLYREEAIELLRRFYISGNPKAPKPHRKVETWVDRLTAQVGGVTDAAAALGAAEN